MPKLFAGTVLFCFSWWIAYHAFLDLWHLLAWAVGA